MTGDKFIRIQNASLFYPILNSERAFVRGWMRAIAGGSDSGTFFRDTSGNKFVRALDDLTRHEQLPVAPRGDVKRSRGSSRRG